MYRHLTEIGLLLQFLGVIPPVVNSLLPDRVIYDREVGIPVAEKLERDRIAVFVGLALVAAGAIFQFLAVYLAP
jgi:hypothetical protein